MRSIYTAAGALLLATHALLAQTVATAPTTPPAVAAPDWLLDQPKVIAEAKDVTTEKYPDADTVMVSEYQRTEYKADGSFVTLDDQYVRCSPRLAARMLGSARLVSMPHTAVWKSLESMSSSQMVQ